MRRQLTELKLELRSLYASLEAISSNEVSATLLRALEGIRHLLASLAERAKKLEDVIGDPAKLARSIVADDVVARVSFRRGEGGGKGEGMRRCYSILLCTRLGMAMLPRTAVRRT